MPNEPEHDTQADAPRPPAEENIATEKKSWRLRLACLLLVAVAAAVIYVIEIRAEGLREESVKALQEKMPETVTLETERQKIGLYRTDIDELLVGDPDRNYDALKFSEVITWPGVLRLYRVRLQCVTGEYVIEVEPETVWRWEE